MQQLRTCQGAHAVHAVRALGRVCLVSVHPRAPMLRMPGHAHLGPCTRLEARAPEPAGSPGHVQPWGHAHLGTLPLAPAHLDVCYHWRVALGTRSPRHGIGSSRRHTLLSVYSAMSRHVLLGARP